MPQKFEIGARAVHTEKRNANSALSRETNRLGGAAHRFLARDAVGLQLDVADGRLNHRCPQAQADQFLHIAARGARKAPYFGVLQPSAQDQRNGFAIFGGNFGKAGFNPSHTKLVKLLRDFKFLLRTEDDADGLLAVTQRSVVKANGSRAIKFRPNAGPRIQLAGPDFAGKIAHRAAPCSSAASVGGFSP